MRSKEVRSAKMGPLCLDSVCFSLPDSSHLLFCGVGWRGKPVRSSGVWGVGLKNFFLPLPSPLS